MYGGRSDRGVNPWAWVGRRRRAADCAPYHAPVTGRGFGGLRLPGAAKRTTEKPQTAAGILLRQQPVKLGGTVGMIVLNVIHAAVIGQQQQRGPSGQVAGGLKGIHGAKLTGRRPFNRLKDIPAMVMEQNHPDRHWEIAGARPRINNWFIGRTVKRTKTGADILSQFLRPPAIKIGSQFLKSNDNRRLNDPRTGSSGIEVQGGIINPVGGPRTREVVAGRKEKIRPGGDPLQWLLQGVAVEDEGVRIRIRQRQESAG